MSVRGRLLVATACVWMFGCGGAQKAPPAAPMPGGYEQQRSAPVDRDTASPEAESESAGDMPASSPEPRRKRGEARQPGSRYAQPPEPVDGLRGAGADVWSLLEDFTLAEGLTLSDQGGCENACRALRSMIRSCERLCAIAQDEEEQRVCEEVRRRARAARDHVRAACGRCVHGPALDEEP